ncbi:hypothetical protein LCGC14_2153550 [marine sediment metagenome]|uniref:Uncharacterized protein n=1 Tax=marine sediment metagenome TaxID=412755 RepID=A0A0F9G7U8_9ZZZZ
MEFKTIKELNKCNPGFRDGYNRAKKDVSGLIDEDPKLKDIATFKRWLKAKIQG